MVSQLSLCKSGFTLRGPLSQIEMIDSVREAFQNDITKIQPSLNDRI